MEKIWGLSTRVRAPDYLATEKAIIPGVGLISLSAVRHKIQGPRNEILWGLCGQDNQLSQRESNWKNGLVG